MKQPGKFPWKGKLTGGLFGILAGPFGIFLGFLVGHLIDLIVESSTIRRAVAAFLADPGDSALSRWENGMYSYFTLGAAAFTANGGVTRRSRESLFRILGDIYPIRDGDYKYLQEILEYIESPEGEILLPAHAMLVGEAAGENGKEELFRGLIAFAAASEPPTGAPPGARSPGTEDSRKRGEAGAGTKGTEDLRNPALEFLRGIAWLWELDADVLAEFRRKPSSGESAWEILGLKPGAPVEEVKRVFRILAAQFHPDGASALSDIQKKETEEAFRRIRLAYDECMAGLTRSAG